MTANQTPKRDDDEAHNQNPMPEQGQEAPLYDSFSESLDTAPQEETAQPKQVPIEDPRIATLAGEVALLKDQLMRALAETENMRKRAQREREDASRFAISGFSKDILSVADNLRRALDSIPAQALEQMPQIKNLTDGIEATERELLRSFEKNGIVRVEPLDQPFDANFHEVMFEAPMPDKPNGTIIQVIEAGYTLNGRLLRPARVGVAKSAIQSQTGAASPGHTLDTQA